MSGTGTEVLSWWSWVRGVATPVDKDHFRACFLHPGGGLAFHPGFMVSVLREHVLSELSLTSKSLSPISRPYVLLAPSLLSLVYLTSIEWNPSSVA
jgi:hypothetical protein